MAGPRSQALHVRRLQYEIHTEFRTASDKCARPGNEAIQLCPEEWLVQKHNLPDWLLWAHTLHTRTPCNDDKGCILAGDTQLLARDMHFTIFETILFWYTLCKLRKMLSPR